MYRFLLCLLAVAATAGTVRSQGIAARSTAESLRDLHGVHVVVEEVIPAVRQAGLTAAGIKSAVEDHLVKRGVPVLGLGELTMDPRSPTLLIQLDFEAADPVYFYSSQVQFFQNVTVDFGSRDIPAYASASTWQTSKVGKAGKFRLPQLANEVISQVDGFIDAYLSMNGAQQPEQEMEEDTTSVEGAMGGQVPEQQ